MAVEELGLRLSATGAVQTAAGVDLAGKAAENLGTKADATSAALDRHGRSAKELRAAYRMLPAQITDVVTSLASGQQPWQVAIQQGGQIKDSFGGAGATFRALGAVISPLTAGIMGLGTAAALATLAYTRGAAEAQAYHRAIVLTGNAAGTTSGQLGDMARGIAAGVGTQGRAAEVLTQLTASGRVAADQLQRTAEMAIRLERVAGVAVEDTVKAFVELGRDPVSASVRLNESTNHLTLKLYEQIRALQEQGKHSAAAALAQKAYADVLQERLPQIESRLGLLERGWNAVTGAAKNAWDAMLDIGREKTLQQQLDAVNKALAAPVQRGTNPLQADQRREAMRQRQAELQEQIRLERRAADMQATQAAATRDAIAKREDEKNPRAARADPYQQLNDSIQRRLALAKAELEAGDQLSQSERFRVELLREIDAAQKKIGASRAADLRSQVEAAAQQMRQVEAQREAARVAEQRRKDFVAEREQAGRAAEAEAERMAAHNRTLADETAALELSRDALFRRGQEQLRATIAQREFDLSIIDGLPGYERQAAAMRRQIELMKEQQGLQQGKFVAETHKKEADENKKRQDDLADSITNGMLEGFRNGQSIAEAFRRELVGQFAATILRPSVQMLVGQVYDGGSGGWLNSLLGGIGGSIAGMFGGARAGGGPVQRGRMYQVNEAGPELISVGQRSYLMMGAQDGQVTPAGGGGGGARGGGATINYSPTIHIDSRTDRAEVLVLVQRASRQSQAELLEMMERGQV